MRKKTLFLIVLLGLVLTSSRAMAQVNIDGVRISSDGETTSSVELYFSGNSPFKIFRSIDGINWGTPLASGLAEGFYADSGRTNYVNYYYKVEDAGKNTAFTIAFPPGQNPHGSFKLNSYFCACCHITHAAEGVYLLAAPNAVALCTTCHDGTQSKYDVRSGKVKLATGWEESSAGPFGPLQTGLSVELAVYEGYDSNSETEVGVFPTSIHNLGTQLLYAPGGISTRETGLGCTDCHDAHGNENFRNLKTNIRVGEGLATGINFKAYAQTDLSGVSEYGEKIHYERGSIVFCSACHSDFNQVSGSGSLPATSTRQEGFYLSDDSMHMFMHAVNTPLIWRNKYLTSKLPVEYGTGTNVITCLTCHQAHGTFATVVSKATGSSALIRMDRQAVCEECHKK